MIAAIEATQAPAPIPRRRASVTLGQSIQALVTAKKAANCRSAYVAGLGRYLRMFAAGREDTLLRDVDIDTVEDWFTARNESITARQSNIGRLGALFAFAVRRQWIDCNPCAFLEKARIDRKAPFILTPLQCALIMDWVKRKKPNQLAYYALTLFAGVRPNELCGVTWDDVKFDDDITTVIIDAAASKVRMRRVVELQPTAALWIRKAKEVKALLPVSVTTRRRFQRQAAKVLGFEGWPQDCLRHTAASFLLPVLKDAGKVAFMLGNSARILETFYKGLVVGKETREFWAITPDSPRPLKPKPDEPEIRLDITTTEMLASALPSGQTLSRFARAEAALKMEPTLRALGKERQRAAGVAGAAGQKPEGERVDTMAELAVMAGISRETIQFSKFLLRHADPDVIAKLRAGKLAIRTQRNKLVAQLHQTAPSAA